MEFQLIKEGLLKHPYQNNICYRKAICYPLFRYLSKGNNKQSSVDEFLQMASAFKKNEAFILKGYLELHPIPTLGDHKDGWLMIDPSRGYYPLVFYPDSHSERNKNQPNKTRVSALETTINKIKKRKAEIFDIMLQQLNSGEKWSMEMEAKLEPFFEYPPKANPATGANDSIFKKAA